MTYKELCDVAARFGLVRWDKSGVVEYLCVAKDNRVIARLFKTSRRKAVPLRTDGYNCKEVTRETLDEAAAIDATAKELLRIHKQEMKKDE